MKTVNEIVSDIQEYDKKLSKNEILLYLYLNCKEQCESCSLKGNKDCISDILYELDKRIIHDDDKRIEKAIELYKKRG